MQTPNTSHTCSVWRLESDDPLVGGVGLRTPSGITLAAYWRQSAPVIERLELAKDVSAKLLNTLITKHDGKDTDRVNWPSVVAACQYHIGEWNDKRRAALHVEGDTQRQRDAAQLAEDRLRFGLEGVGGGGGGALH
jgi:hypothetical protein